MTVESPTVIQWVLDTRSLWPEAAETADLSRVASSALALLSAEERESVLRYFRVRDAKLALGSALLKRYVISRFTGVSWREATAVRDARTKPVFLMPGDKSEPLLFNLTHQDGLVVMLAVHRPPPGLAIGVDIVSPLERHDRDVQMIEKEGWASFVDMHAEVFSQADVSALKRLSLRNSDGGVDRALRQFYAVWCLREAYVKMTGEALVAEWLGDLEMRHFATPEDAGPDKPALQVWFKGARLSDVDMTLRPLLDNDYMVSTAVRHGRNGETVRIDDFKGLTMDEVVAFGEKAT